MVFYCLLLAKTAFINVEFRIDAGGATLHELFFRFAYVEIMIEVSNFGFLLRFSVSVRQDIFRAWQSPVSYIHRRENLRSSIFPALIYGLQTW